MNTDILDTILAQKRETAAHLPPPATFARRDYHLGDRRDFEAAIRTSGLSVIAEIKRESPSRGRLAPDLDPAQLATAYELGGASAISCLTDVDFFGAQPGDLLAARSASTLPLLRKDFIVDERQIHESAAMGADAILLIARALTSGELESFINIANRLELSALVEVHDEPELAKALVAGASIIGVNNRDLRTFDVNLETAERLRERIPLHCIAVAESGIHNIDDMRRMANAGYDAVLIGESLVRSADPTGMLSLLLEASPAPSSSGGVR